MISIEEFFYKYFMRSRLAAITLCRFYGLFQLLLLLALKLGENLGTEIKRNGAISKIKALEFDLRLT